MHSRRDFIRQSGLVAVGFLGLQKFAFGQFRLSEKAGYGPLQNDPNGILNLPAGFRYKIISKVGTRMSDGFYLPGAPDGMATFSDSGKMILVRNHELSPGDMEQSAFGANAELLKNLDKALIYDYGKGEKVGVGGTTNLVFDEETMTVEKEFISLAGTHRNCAGGPTPWGSWITCEETSARADDILEKDHGYNFEVTAIPKMGVQNPVPLKAMGRFTHEAVAVDPATHIVYQTEDAGDGMIYRFIPDQPGDLSKGRLQALRIRDWPSCDTRNWAHLTTKPFPIRTPMDVEWMDLEDIDAPESDLRLRGFDKGAARFARGEGAWFGNGDLYFACTNGGKQSNGQIFRYRPDPKEQRGQQSKTSGTLELFIESEDAGLLEHGDNLTVSPWGDVVVCEDKSSTPRIVGVTPAGELYHFALNVGYKSEFAGVCFSPSGRTMFVNIQGAGLTLAVQGPWKTT